MVEYDWLGLTAVFFHETIDFYERASTMRIYEIAKACGIESKAVMTHARRYGIVTKSASTLIEPIAALTLISFIRKG